MLTSQKEVDETYGTLKCVLLSANSCIPYQYSVSNDKWTKYLVASEGYHMLIATKYRVNAAAAWKEGKTQK